MYKEVDFELANTIFPFVKKRFLEHLKDTTSFSNPYDSLSKYIGIKGSSDGFLKTYSWTERHMGCCRSYEIYAQFKTKSNKIKFINLDEDPTDEEIYITNLKKIEINKKPYYLILGWGTCCGAKYYSTADVYQIKNDSLYRSKAIFDNKDKLHIGANRRQQIDLKYSGEKNILSYNSYKMNDNSGFYKKEKTV